MKVVAFLQNQWFKDPERVKKIIADTIERESREDGSRDAAGVREYYIAAFLFMGCVTGRRLCAALGDDWCEEIVWEEVSKEIGGKSSSVFPPDFDHIRDVLDRHRPDVVLAFGKVAADALRQCDAGHRFPMLVGPHPAARHATVMDELREVRHKLDDYRPLPLTLHEDGTFEVAP